MACTQSIRSPRPRVTHSGAQHRRRWYMVWWTYPVPEARENLLTGATTRHDARRLGFPTQAVSGDQAIELTRHAAGRQDTLAAPPAVSQVHRLPGRPAPHPFLTATVASR